MPLSLSTMPDLGTPLPDFRLTDVTSGLAISPASYADTDALLAMFICCHCPFTRHVRHQIAQIVRDYGDRPLGIVAICSNDAEQHPEDGPAGLKALVAELRLTCPVCFDESQEVAKTFHAACTPEFFLFNRERRLVYRGRLDGSRPKSPTPVTGDELRAAIEATLAGRPVSSEQQPSLGCNIKWRAGHEPVYYQAALMR